MVTNVIHIGLPKCASTTLQDRLFSPQERFTYIGRIKNGYLDDETRELIERITVQDSLEYDPALATSLLRSLLAKASAPERPILVSAESLSVEGRADRRLVAERLHRLFAPAKVLIVLRAQPTMLQSMYLNHLRGSGQPITSFDHWLDKVYGAIRFPEVYRVPLNYEPLVRAYDAVFGGDNVVVLPFELIKDEKSVFYQRLAETLQLALNEVQASFRGNVDNQRMSKRHLLALYMQGRMTAGTNLALFGRRMLPMAVYRTVRDFVVGGRRVSSPALSERWRAKINLACAHGNAQLEIRKKIKLAALGYPTET